MIDCLPYVFCVTLLDFGMDRRRTPAPSKMKPFCDKSQQLESLLLYIYIYIQAHTSIYKMKCDTEETMKLE